MRPNRHLAGCIAVIAVAAVAVMLSGGAPASLALLAAALLCPLAMGVAVWLLLRAGTPPASSAPREQNASQVQR